MSIYLFSVFSAMYISYGGLLMRLEGEPRHLKGFSSGQNVYLLAKTL